MASITCTKCGAVLKTKAPVAPGKKLKCPTCEEVFVVQDKEEPEEEELAGEEGAEDEEEKPKKKRKPRDDDEDADESDEEEAKPKKKDKSKQKGKGDAKKGSPMVLIIGGVAVVVLLLLVGVGGFGGWYFFLRDGRTNDGVAKNADKDGKKGILSAEDLSSSDAGKDLELTAEVVGIDRHNRFSVKGPKLEGTKLYQNIPCDVDEAVAPQVLKLSIGQKVKLNCKLRQPSGLSLQVSALTELEQSKLVPVQADKLAKEFVKDFRAMSEKVHSDGGVIVTGVVIRVLLDGRKQRSGVLMKGNGNAQIAIGFDPGSNQTAKDLAALEAGDEIEVRCTRPINTIGAIQMNQGMLIRRIRSGVEVSPDFRLSAVAFANEFAANEDSSLEQYSNKLLEVTGVVEEVTAFKQVFLKGDKQAPGGPGGPYRVELKASAKNLPLAIRLVPGQKIKVVGICSGREPKLWVTLSDCAITEIDKSTILVVTAEALAQEFETDPKGASDKYKLRYAMITGVLEDIQNKQPRQATFKGSAKLKVRATIMANNDPQPTNGDTVEFRAFLGGQPFFNNELRVVSYFVISTKK